MQLFNIQPLSSWILILLLPALLFSYTDPAFSQTSYTWTGSLSTNYDLPGNWSPSGLPGQLDTIILNSGSINISAGSPLLLGGIYISGGTISSARNVSFTGKMLWSGGTWSGTGTLICPAAAGLFIAGTLSKTLSQGILENRGTLSWEGSGNLSLGDGATLNNTGLFEIRNNATVVRAAGTLPQFNNLATGIIRKTSSSGKSTIGQSVTFNNQGLLEVLTGSLELSSSGTFSGTLEIKNSSPLILSLGQITWTSGSVLKTEGEVRLSGSYGFGGSFEAGRKTSISGGTSNFSGSLIKLGDTLNITGGTINFQTVADSIPVIQMSSGYLGGTGTVNVARVFNWSGGNLTDAGSLNLAEAADMFLTGEQTKYIVSKRVSNYGFISWEGSGNLSLGDGATLNNTGLFEIRNNATVVRAAGTLPFFNNLATGIIRKLSDGITTIGQAVNFTQQGQVDVQKGTLVLGVNGTYTGIIRSSAATVISINLGTHNFNPGAGLELGGIFQIIGGSTRINLDYTLPRGTLLKGGELGGSGIINVKDTLFWSGGNIVDTGRLSIDTNGVLIISGTLPKAISQRKINNSGTMLLRSSTLSLSPYAVINNDSKLNIEGPIDIGAWGGSGPYPQINNHDSGEFVMNAFSGPVNIVGPYFTNSGYLEISNGTFDVGLFQFAGLFNQTRGITRIIDGQFRASRGIRIEGGMLAGTGNIIGNVFNSGIISPGPDEGLPGSLSVSGQYTQDTAGVLLIDIGGRNPGSGYDQFTVGSALLSGDLEINYLGNFIPLPVDKFRIVRWLGEPAQGSFDTITNLEFREGLVLNAKYTPNDLTLHGSAAAKDLWVQLVGADAVRPGTDNIVTILYGNESADTVVFPMLLEFKDMNDVTLLFDYVHFPSWIPWEDSTAVDMYPLTVRDIIEEGNKIFIPLMVTIPGRGSSEPMQNFYQFRVSLNPMCDGNASITVSIGEALNPDIQSCLWDIAGQLVGFLPGGACVEAGAKVALSGMQAYSDDLHGKPVTLGGWITSNGWDVAKCAVSFVPGLSLVTKTASILDKIMTGGDLYKLASDCGAVLLPQEDGKTSRKSYRCVSSSDPNAKAGPDGNGPSRYITAMDPSAYIIYFENLDTATAPAQTVIITDTMNTGHWDFSTFSFAGISFGDTLVFPPSYVKEFYLEVDLRPENNLITGITGSLDEETGVITWLFVSLDPETGNPTTDALAGFLPPNVTSPEGEGSVSYIVQSNLDLPSGTVLGSPATIVFDNNEALVTNHWMNYIDRSDPESSMNHLGETQISGQFEVSWTGSDVHSGIARYNLFVAENGGPFHKWASTPNTSYVFTGDSCSNYVFYVIAVDSAGNREKEKDFGIPVTINPFIQPLLEAVGESVICEGDSVLLRAEPGDSLLYEWYKDDELLQDEHEGVYYAKVSGVYSVMVGRSETCSGVSDPLTVFVNPLPSAMITSSENLLETTGGAMHQWYLDLNPIEGANGSNYLAETSGAYQVLITDFSGCSRISDIYQHLVISLDVINEGLYRLFPNPANDKLYIHSTNGMGEGLIIRIVDVNGRIVYSGRTAGLDQDFEIDVVGLAPGEYFLQLFHDRIIGNFKFSKVH